MLELASRNASQAFHDWHSPEEAAAEALDVLAGRLGLAGRPTRIECFDVSELHGGEAVAAMVVFENGLPASDSYRSFRIGEPASVGDPQRLAEALRRRFARGVEFGRPPDLLLVDGGSAQAETAARVLLEAGMEASVVAAGIAKSRVLDGGPSHDVERSPERVFLPGRPDPVVPPEGSPDLRLLQRIRDEAHRFAIGLHRKVRARRLLRSALDAVPGIGPARRTLLLRHFGSVKRIKEASLEELIETPGLPATVARAMHEALHKQPSSPESGVPVRIPD
jgi:excinuclease ABC subunit C